MAGPTTDTTGQIVKAQKAFDPKENLIGLVQRMGSEIARALPKHITPDRMARIVLTAVRTNEDLARCSPASFLGCVMQASQLGLEPNTPLGHLYLIPRGGQCTMIVGYQGFIELARRSGLVSNVYAYAVRERDFFEHELGLNPTLKHRPADDPAREGRGITHVYAVAAMRDSSERVFEVLTKAQVEARRGRSPASKKGPWVTDYEAMALKTAVRALWKWLPKSSELARAEAIEVAGEAGLAQAQALDPGVADVLGKHVLLPDEAPSTDTSVEAHDPETGEVRNAS